MQDAQHVGHTGCCGVDELHRVVDDVERAFPDHVRVEEVGRLEILGEQQARLLPLHGDADERVDCAALSVNGKHQAPTIETLEAVAAPQLTDGTLLEFDEGVMVGVKGLLIGERIEPRRLGLRGRLLLLRRLVGGFVRTLEVSGDLPSGVLGRDLLQPGHQLDAVAAGLGERGLAVRAEANPYVPGWSNNERGTSSIPPRSS